MMKSLFLVSLTFMAMIAPSAGANAQTTETLSFIERANRADGSVGYTNIDLIHPVQARVT